MNIKFIFLALVVLIGCVPTISNRESKVEEVRFAMGSILSISGYISSPEKRGDLIKCADIVHDLEDKLSNYLPDSEISRVNREGGRARIKISEETFILLKEAKRLSELTDGAFDVTVRPLVEVWSRAATDNRIPSEAKIRSALNRVGYKNIDLSVQGTVAFKSPGVSIETGGIGKGYAVDRVADCLMSSGIRNALVDFGRSSMAALGAPEGKNGWEVRVDFGDGLEPKAINLKNARLSISRSKGRPQIINGKQFGHLFDPKTGELVANNSGAYVISHSATEAEALSKALVIRGSKFADNITGDFDYEVANDIL